MTFETIVDIIRAHTVHTAAVSAAVLAILTATAKLGLDPASLPRRWQWLPALALNVGLMFGVAMIDHVVWWVAILVGVVGGTLGAMGSIGGYHTLKRALGG